MVANSMNWEFAWHLHLRCILQVMWASESNKRLFKWKKRIIKDCLTVPYLSGRWISYDQQTLQPAGICCCCRHTKTKLQKRESVFDKTQKTIAYLILCILDLDVIIFFQIISAEASQWISQKKQWRQICNHSQQKGSDIFHGKEISTAKSRRQGRIFPCGSCSLACMDQDMTNCPIFSHPWSDLMHF